MGAEHPQVFATAPMVFFAASPKFKDSTDLALLEQVRNLCPHRTETRGMTNHQPSVRSFAGRDNLIGFRNGSAKRLSI